MAGPRSRRRSQNDAILRAYQVAAAAPTVERVGAGGDHDDWDLEESGWPALFGESDLGARPRVRVSVIATAGAVVSVVGLCAVLTGLLVGEGLVVAGVGFGLSLAGLVAANRPARVGAGLAGLGIVCSLAALTIGIAVLAGVLSWPSAATDEVSRVHGWLREHWGWLPHRS